jgi:AraC-like DNA-binding protein
VAARTTDLDHAEELIRGNTGVFSVAPADATAFSFALTRGGDSRGMVSRFSYRAEFETENVHDAFTIASIAEGSMRWEMGTTRGTEADGPFLQAPGVRMRTWGSRVTADGVSLPCAFLSRIACQVHAVDSVDLRFASPRCSDANHARLWLRLTSLAATMRDSGALEHDLVRAAVLRNLAFGVLEWFPLASRPEAGSRAWRARTELLAYRRARDFFDDHASLPITVEDAAQHAGVPTATLVRAFAAHAPLGLTPAQYLRRARLAAAHLDLVRGDPTRGDSVREIALRWGFPHPGAFAAHYRAVYGHNPKWVLDR